MKKYSFLFVLILIGMQTVIHAQSSFWFGPKGGLAINTQRWDNFERDPLFAFQGDIFIESYDEFSPSSLYAQVGFHTRGSATRYIGFNSGSNFTNTYKFYNLGLTVGAKRVIKMDSKYRPYYILGLRAEYTIDTNLDEYDRFGSPFYPNDAFVKKFNYGVTLGGGFEYKISELIGGILEFAVNPDLSLQYEQDPVSNVIVPFSTNTINLPRREVRNLSLEISLGFRFLRKVEYID